MTTTHSRARRRGLPRPTLTGAVLLLLTAVGFLQTWPIQTGTAIALVAAVLIVRAIRPARLTRLWTFLDQAADRRRDLPSGYISLDHFLRMGHVHFEHAVAALAQAHPDVRTAHRVGGANDRGADVLAHLYDGRRILIQCKHHRPGNNVGSAVVQTINGVYRDIHHCHSAVIVTTAGFTRDAVRTTAMLPQPIRLIDGHALTAWANGHTPAPW